MPVKLVSAGGGAVTLNVPNTGSNFTADVPARNGALVGADSSGNFFMNSGYGSEAVAYGCRAWVNFNGTGTPAIRASANISSITDNGVGDNTMNFINAMPDINYCVVQACGVKNISWGLHLFAGLSGYGNSDAFATNRFRAITVTPADSTGDTPILCYAVFR